MDGGMAGTSLGKQAPGLMVSPTAVDDGDRHGTASAESRTRNGADRYMLGHSDAETRRLMLQHQI
jgi:hypothetical protein